MRVTVKVEVSPKETREYGISSTCTPLHRSVMYFEMKRKLPFLSRAIVDWTSVSTCVRLQVVPEAERGSLRHVHIAERHERQCNIGFIDNCHLRRGWEPIKVLDTLHILGAVTSSPRGLAVAEDKQPEILRRY